MCLHAIFDWIFGSIHPRRRLFVDQLDAKALVFDDLGSARPGGLRYTKCCESAFVKDVVNCHGPLGQAFDRFSVPLTNEQRVMTRTGMEELCESIRWGKECARILTDVFDRRKRGFIRKEDFLGCLCDLVDIEAILLESSTLPTCESCGKGADFFFPDDLLQSWDDAQVQSYRYLPRASSQNHVSKDFDPCTPEKVGQSCTSTASTPSPPSPATTEEKVLPADHGADVSNDAKQIVETAWEDYISMKKAIPCASTISTVLIPRSETELDQPEPSPGTAGTVQPPVGVTSNVKYTYLLPAHPSSVRRVGVVAGPVLLARPHVVYRFPECPAFNVATRLTASAKWCALSMSSGMRRDETVAADHAANAATRC